MKYLTRVMTGVLVLALFICPVAQADSFSGVTVRLAQQYGMQYAPVYVMQKMGILEKHLPGATLEWSNLGGGSAMNEAMIAGRLDIAFMGIPPVVIAWDKGVDYRIAAGICVPPAELMVQGDKIASLADITPEDRIAVPSIGSIQHIMLSMAADSILGDANALDNNIIAMANPDAYAALISGTDVTAHFASMPYIDLETEAGMKSILTGSQACPAQASIVCVTTKALHENAAVYEGLLSALEEAIALINAQGDEVISIISQEESITEEAARKYLNWPGTSYTTEIFGVFELAEFMSRHGYIEGHLDSLSDITW